MKLSCIRGVYESECDINPIYQRSEVAMNTTRKTLFTVFVIVVNAIFIGCSPTGWSTKQIPDGSSIENGSQVTVIGKDGATYTGSYEGVVSNPSMEYVERYATTSDGSQLPLMGERVTFTTAVTGDKIWEGDFVGFDEKNLWIKINNTPTDIYFSSIYHLADSRGHILQRMNLRSLFVEGVIPLMATVVIKHNNETYRVPVNEIHEITVLANYNDFTPGRLSMNGDQFRTSLME